MAKKKKISRRPKAVNPRGFVDYCGEEVIRRQSTLAQITEVFRRYGFSALETPALETLDALGKYLPDTDRPNEGVFAWKEDDDWVALRYDLTAPLARFVAQNRNDLPIPYRRYAVGPVWRNEKPGPGRFRQFYQCDADTVGTGSVAADAEICALTAEIFDVLGFARKDFLVKINSRKILDGLLSEIGVFEHGDSNEHRKTRGTVLRALDKLERVGIKGVMDLLGAGRLDESGDFSEGAGLSDSQAEIIKSYLQVADENSARVVSSLRDLVGGTSAGSIGLDELQSIAEMLDVQGVGSDVVKIDPSIVRGLGYYTGPVFEVDLQLEILDDKGRPRQFGSVAGGGRYDGLVQRFTGQQVPATGVSIGVDRLLAALGTLRHNEGREVGPIVITVMDRERYADYMAMASELRNAGIPAEVYLGNQRSIGRQLKYADLRNAPLAVIEGDQERARGVVQVKDLVLGSKIAETATLEEWQSRPSQLEVRRENLVEEIAQIIATQR